MKYKIWDKANKKWVDKSYCINQYGFIQIKDVVFTDNDDFKFVELYVLTGKNTIILMNQPKTIFISLKTNVGTIELDITIKD